MTSMGLLFILFREPMVRLFIDADTPPQEAATIIALGGQFLIATAAFQFFDAIAMTLSGALRGAGDTIWVGVVTVILSWTIIVGGGLALIHLAPQLSSLGPWIAAASYIILLSLAILARFLRGHWRSIRLLTPDPTTTPAPTPTSSANA
jgi:MATE family multidrug resistance protein